MRKSRFTESQIVAILKELDAGTPAAELSRRHDIDANTIRLWRDRYAGLEVCDLTRPSTWRMKAPAKIVSSRD